MKIVNRVLISASESDIINGHLTIPSSVTSIGDDFLYNCSSLTSVTIPSSVTSIGDYFLRYCSSLTSVTIKNGMKLSVKCVDGYLFVIEKEKTSKGIRIYTGYNFLSMTKNEINKQECFVAEKDGFTAHGDSAKKAIQDLNFKIIAEQLQKEPILPDTIITVQYYRIVTGACELGCKSFIEQNGLKKESYKAKELLPILERHNAYGLDKFKSLINF